MGKFRQGEKLRLHAFPNRKIVFYVYQHIRNDTKEVFYIGKGCGKRAYVKSRRSVYWQRIVEKYGYSIKIIEAGLTEQQAKELEISLIAKFGRKDKGLGLLINNTDGGEGTVGFTQPQHVRDAVANSNRNRVSSKEHKKAVSAIYKGKFGSEHNRSKKVICLETGAEYGSMSEASRLLNIAISSVHWSVNNLKPIFGMHFQIAN